MTREHDASFPGRAAARSAAAQIRGPCECAGPGSSSAPFHAALRPGHGPRVPAGGTLRVLTFQRTPRLLWRGGGGRSMSAASGSPFGGAQPSARRGIYARPHLGQQRRAGTCGRPRPPRCRGLGFPGRSHRWLTPAAFSAASFSGLRRMEAHSAGSSIGGLPSSAPLACEANDADTAPRSRLKTPPETPLMERGCEHLLMG